MVSISGDARTAARRARSPTENSGVRISKGPARSLFDGGRPGGLNVARHLMFEELHRTVEELGCGAVAHEMPDVNA